MSVVVQVIFRASDREPLHLPVATEAVFSHDWLPAAVRLGLDWIPGFDAGLTLGPGDLPALLADLVQIHAEFTRASRTYALLPRVDALLAALSTLDPAEVHEIWIG